VLHIVNVLADAPFIKKNLSLSPHRLFRDDPNGAEIWMGKGTLHQRKYRESLGPTTLSQVVGEAMLNNDKTLTTYDPDTDQCLVACHTKTWDRRRNTSRFVTSDTTTGYCSVCLVGWVVELVKRKHH
jgi:hypothetical protein